MLVINNISQCKGKIRLRVLGAGAVSEDLHLPDLVNTPHAYISWICDKDEGARN